MSCLILLDIDHTLLGEGGQLPRRNLEALHAARRGGAVIVLATARSYVGAKPIHEALELDTPLIVSNGTMVCSPDGEVVNSEPIGADLAKTIVDVFLSSEHHWAFRNVEAAFLHPEFVTDLPHMQDQRHYRPTPVEALPQVLGDMSTLVSASLFSNGTVLDDFFASRDWAQYGLRHSFYPSNNFVPRQVFTVISGRASKGVAARWLIDELGMQGNDVLAFGDSPDDVSMYELGIGIAPANACAEARDVADWVVPACDEGAVAAGLERYFAGLRVS